VAQRECHEGDRHDAGEQHARGRERHVAAQRNVQREQPGVHEHTEHPDHARRRQQPPLHGAQSGHTSR